MAFWLRQNEICMCAYVILFSVLLFFIPFAHAEEPSPLKAQLGEQLFFDVDLSQNRTQSCATCHDPSVAFIDARDNGVAGMVSLGDDGVTLGVRNAPSLSYALFSPTFSQLKDGAYRGGQFYDGRANDLQHQAGFPLLEKGEMGLETAEKLLTRILEKEDYIAQFSALYGKSVLQDAQQTFSAVTDAIAAFQKTEIFAPFSSKYDRFLRGEVALTETEELGRLLFFSQQFTNCNQCHQLQPIPGAKMETFSDYRYHNIGVPVNTKLANYQHENLHRTEPDQGLFANSNVDAPTMRGKFKTPTLRNIAVTGPYMHNGVFEKLETVIAFYNQYNSRKAKAKINPETGKNWAAPEIKDTLALKELEMGNALDKRRIKALVAFLKTLTDERYAYLLD